MYVAAILKVKGRNVVTTTADKSLLDVAKLLDQQDIGCIVIEGDDGQVAGRGDLALAREAINIGEGGAGHAEVETALTRRSIFLQLSLSDCQPRSSNFDRGFCCRRHRASYGPP